MPPEDKKPQQQAKPFRTEKDSLGEVRVPAGAYYGAQTQRAVENFPISGLRLQPAFIRAQAVVKLSAARANAASGALSPKTARAIEQAAQEIIKGKLADQFVVDALQAGAGTSQNMNMNEVIASRAAELLGGKRGDRSLVHPNDHVNMSQSTNDTVHTAIHIAAACEITARLLPALASLEKALRKKSRQFDNILKTGRTHLQDAVPIRLGQEFGAYATMVSKSRRRVQSAADSLLELCVGGTAVGTGLNTDPKYRKRMIKNINELTGQKFREAENMFEAMQSFDTVVETAGALRVLTTSLKKIADDLRLLSSGPRAGLAEIRLPAVQPGSSIMPGKINPVMCEMLNMACFHSLGCDAAVTAAAQAGQLELNVMMPVIAYNLLQQINILSNAVNAFSEKCVTGIEANEPVCNRNAENSASVATALAPAIGYDKTAALAKEALKLDTTIRKLATEKNILPPKKLNALLNIRRMTEDPAEGKKK